MRASIQRFFKSLIVLTLLVSYTSYAGEITALNAAPSGIQTIPNEDNFGNLSKRHRAARKWSSRSIKGMAFGLGLGLAAVGAAEIVPDQQRTTVALIGGASGLVAVASFYSWVGSWIYRAYLPKARNRTSFPKTQRQESFQKNRSDTVRFLKEPKWAEDAVTIWNSRLLHHRGKYGTNSVRLFIDFHNLTNKRLVGVLTKTTVKNAFGRKLLSTTFENELNLAPGERNKTETFWSFEDNQFIKGELYDRMWKTADDGTATIEHSIRQVILEGGIVLKPKPKRSK